MQNYLTLFEIQSRDICTLTPTKRPLSTFVCIDIQHDSKSSTTVAVMLNFKIQNPLTDISLHRKLDTQSWFLLCFTPFIRVVKRSRLPAKIATYLVNISRLLCLAFLYGWRFLNKISLGWPLTLTTQPSTSNFLTTLLYMILLKTDISLRQTLFSDPRKYPSY